MTCISCRAAMPEGSATITMIAYRPGKTFS
jgi:hypothetical protein